MRTHGIRTHAVAAQSQPHAIPVGIIADPPHQTRTQRIRHDVSRDRRTVLFGSQGVIVKLRIPEAAKRSHAFGRKCRAEYADVVEVIGADVGISKHDSSTEYRVGQRVIPDRFDENWAEECSSGIHFFITRLEAENY